MLGVTENLPHRTDRGWGDSLLSKVFAAQCEALSSNLSAYIKPGAAVDVCKPSIGRDGVETVCKPSIGSDGVVSGRSPELTGQALQANGCTSVQ